jgi:magnesium transporter
MAVDTAPDPKETTADAVSMKRRTTGDQDKGEGALVDGGGEAPNHNQDSPGRGHSVARAADEVVTAEGAATHKRSELGDGEKVLVWLCTATEEPKRIELDAVPDLVAHDQNFIWIDLINYTPDDLQGVAEKTRLDARAVHSTLSPWKRPRLDVFGDQFFVTVTIPELDFKAYQILARELDIFVGHNYLVSAHKTTLPFADHILTRAHQSPQLLHQDSAFMLYVILDEVLAYYEGIREDLQDAIETMEARALTAESEDYLKELQRFKRFAFATAQLAAHHQQIFITFLRPDFRWVTGEGVEAYFRDLESRFTRLNEALLAAKDGLNGAFDLYVSHIAHRTNQVIKTLTIVSTTLLPMSVIFGFFGVNNLRTVPLLEQGGGFLLMVLIIAAICGGALLYFSRQGWLR